MHLLSIFRENLMRMDTLPELPPIENQDSQLTGGAIVNNKKDTGRRIPSESFNGRDCSQEIDQQSSKSERAVDVPISDFIHNHVAQLKYQQLESLLSEMQARIFAQEQEIVVLRHALKQGPTSYLNKDLYNANAEPPNSGQSSWQPTPEFHRKTSPMLSTSSGPSPIKLPIPLPSPSSELEHDAESLLSAGTDKTNTEYLGSTEARAALKKAKLAQLSNVDEFRSFIQSEKVNDHRKHHDNDKIVTKARSPLREDDATSNVSPTRSVLIRQRDELEDELLIVYQQMQLESDWGTI